MISNFIFSINAVAPIFLVLFLGYTLRRWEFISAEFVTGGNKLVFYIALPALLFRNVYTAELGDVLDWGFAAFAVAATLGTYAVIWLVSALVIKEKPIRGSFVQGAYRGNFAFLGMPLLINLAGDFGAARAALIMAFVLPLYNISAVVLLSACSGGDSKVGFKTMAMTIVKNPFIIAIVLALVVQLIGIRLPVLVDQGLNQFALMASPLALFCLGAGMRFLGFDARFKYALIASLVKVLAVPLVFVVAAYMVGFRGYDIAAFAILGGIPSAIIGYAMAVQMGSDGYVASTIVVMSTLFSAFTLTVFIYVLRALGVIG